ncbi:hypothetical protein BBK36DRAFT_1144350 [Trichoderma citrinoviride]|uniref:Uncharacterized protein n=1 Tax=Trichoderma citrinoviride TaxID=58853 RepID=A0A2T4B0Q0_9HYPO|nr:hypothetical protein BBK36DRAFT_1144350 [Trichoderma citrinoviride]PTB62808.1 hypothetical protein BBK36DRAFT_1144350 [Trichoderma citrinoviride]
MDRAPEDNEEARAISLVDKAATPGWGLEKRFPTPQPESKKENKMNEKGERQRREDESRASSNERANLSNIRAEADKALRPILEELVLTARLLGVDCKKIQPVDIFSFQEEEGILVVYSRPILGCEICDYTIDVYCYTTANLALLPPDIML